MAAGGRGKSSRGRGRVSTVYTIPGNTNLNEKNPDSSLTLAIWVPPLQEQPAQTPEQQLPPNHQNLNYEEEDEEDDGEEVGGEVGEEDDEEVEEEEQNPNVDYQELLDRLLALPGRQHLLILSKDPIPGVETLWFNRHKGKLSRVISGIVWRKFDGHYFSWKVTPIATQERYFRNFARKYYSDQGVTKLVKEGYLVIAKKRMKGIMWVHWNTEDAIQKSETTSNCRNSDRGGLGVHKHLAGQKYFVQVLQEMEEQLKRRVSFGEVFMKTHTRVDGTFVDQISQHVGEAYMRMLEERMSEIDKDVFKCTLTDGKGNPFGLGSLVETLNKRRRTESYASSSSTVAQLQEQLQLKMSEQAEQNAKCDEEHRQSQSRIASLEKEKDPELDAYLSSDSTDVEPVTLPTTTHHTSNRHSQPTNHHRSRHQRRQHIRHHTLSLYFSYFV
ncbi:hypothetical protein AXX17_AT3G32950 [Arabidopsis thaliana]|uniref:Uncharacterized protein n=1 Tax=Arabidopsis thaliana TaxID=3702 RepID=A0A178VI38_ARATH|nr:hypothetical protein AXX17_AT3G32950 [Arabidopsis thaliana]